MDDVFCEFCSIGACDIFKDRNLLITEHVLYVHCNGSSLVIIGNRRHEHVVPNQGDCRCGSGDIGKGRLTCLEDLTGSRGKGDVTSSKPGYNLDIFYQTVRLSGKYSRIALSIDDGNRKRVPVYTTFAVDQIHCY